MKREYSAFIELLTHRPFTLDKSCSHSHLNRESESERQGSNRTSRQRQRRERKHKISNKRQSETDITSGYFTECSEPENLAVGFSAEGQWLFFNRTGKLQKDRPLRLCCSFEDRITDHWQTPLSAGFDSRPWSPYQSAIYLCPVVLHWSGLLTFCWAQLRTAF